MRQQHPSSNINTSFQNISYYNPADHMMHVKNKPSTSQNHMAKPSIFVAQPLDILSANLQKQDISPKTSKANINFSSNLIGQYVIRNTFSPLSREGMGLNGPLCNDHVLFDADLPETLKLPMIKKSGHHAPAMPNDTRKLPEIFMFPKFDKSQKESNSNNKRLGNKSVDNRTLF